MGYASVELDPQKRVKLKDLYDLEEPLTTLDRDEALLSPEQTAQPAAARAFYEQVFPKCCYAIERILLPFEASYEQEPVK